MRPRLFALILVLSAPLVSSSSAPAAETEVRIDISATSLDAFLVPDAINGLNAQVKQGASYRFAIALRSPILIIGASLQFVTYSPDGSLTQPGVDTISMTPIWDDFNFHTPEAGALSLDRTPDVLPYRFHTFGSANLLATFDPSDPSTGFMSDTLVEIIFVDITFPLEEGIYCIDGARQTPLNQFELYGRDSVVITVLNGGSSDTLVGGVSTTAYCFTVTSQPCCDTPGDANNSGSANIADVTFMVSRIFRNGMAPPCPQEADANADGRVNIADITYLIRRIFAGGPAPVCASTGS